MNILMISYWDFQDHGMQVIKRTPIYFAEKGHHVEFMVHSEQTANPARIVELHPNLTVHRFDLPFKFLAKIHVLKRIRQFVLFTLFCVYQMRKIYGKEKKPDVIYAAECDAILAGQLLKFIYKIPLIVRYYGVSTIQLRKPRKHLFYSLSLKGPADMGIMTDDGTGGLERLTKVNSKIERIEFWRNGVDSVRVDEESISDIHSRFNIEADDFVLLTNSRLYGWKRVDRAIRMLPLLLPEVRRRVKLLVVGDGPERSNLESMAKSLEVYHSVVFTGSINHNEIYDYYAVSDVFLSFYDMSNVGNPLWEALNSGKCIVTLNTGATSNVIKNDVNGILVSSDMSEEMLAETIASKVSYLIENVEYRKKLEQGARDYAKEYLWSWDERLQIELEAIQELVGSKRNAGV